jgi:hypothetical protein
MAVVPSAAAQSIIRAVRVSRSTVIRQSSGDGEHEAYHRGGAALRNMKGGEHVAKGTGMRKETKKPKKKK